MPPRARTRSGRPEDNGASGARGSEADPAEASARRRRTRRDAARYDRPMVGVRLLGIAAAALGLAGPAGACVFDTGVGNPFELPHPRALEVAMAVHGAVQSGAVDGNAIGPELGGEAGLQRASWRLQRLARLLGGAASDEPTIALVLVDRWLWARLTPAALGAMLQVHAAGPAPGDVVAVSSEWVLALLLAGQLSGDEALRQGLVLLEGNAADVQRVAARLARVGAPG